MTDPLDNAFAALAAHIRSISGHGPRYSEIEAAEASFLALKRTLLREIALEMRAEKKTWKQVGDTLGGVTYQRAFQIGHGE